MFTITKHSDSTIGRLMIFRRCTQPPMKAMMDSDTKRKGRTTDFTLRQGTEYVQVRLRNEVSGPMIPLSGINNDALKSGHLHISTASASPLCNQQRSVPLTQQSIQLTEQQVAHQLMEVAMRENQRARICLKESQYSSMTVRMA